MKAHRICQVSHLNFSLLLYHYEHFKIVQLQRDLNELMKERDEDSKIIMALSQKLEILLEENKDLRQNSDDLYQRLQDKDDEAADISNLAQKSLAELNSLEEKAKHSLDRIAKAKEMASSNLEDERVCVICRENPKSVLLMNCRHLCVCSDCGHLDVLVQCPLCREPITERINVFS